MAAGALVRYYYSIMPDKEDTELIGGVDAEEEASPLGFLMKLRTTLLGAFGVMMVAVTLASALNYLFNVIMTRMLKGAGTFSDFYSLTSIFLIVTLGAVSVQTVVTKYVTELHADGEEDKIKLLLRKFTRWLAYTSIVVILVSIAVAWPVASLLKLKSPAFVIILGTAIAVTLFVTVPYGLLQGREQFVALGGATMAVALLRILVGIVLVVIGAGVYGALGAATVGTIVVIAIMMYSTRDMYKAPLHPIEDFNPNRALWFLLPTVAAMFFIILLTQIDAVLVKALFGKAQADTYSYAALAGKAVLFFPEGITLVMFPRVSQLRAKGKPTKGILYMSLAAVTALVGVIVLFFLAFPTFTAKFFTPKGKYASIVALKGPMGIPFISLFGIVMAIFAIVKLLAFYHLALERKAFIILYAVAAAVEIIGIVLFHRTLTSILTVMLIVGLFLLVTNLALALFERPGKEQSDDLSVPGGMPI